MMFQAWSRAYPARAAAYIAHLVEEKQRLKISSGMSPDGNFMYKGAIPEELFCVIQRKYPGFFNDPKNYMAVVRTWIGEDNLPKQKRRLHEIDRTKDYRPDRGTGEEGEGARAATNGDSPAGDPLHPSGPASDAVDS
jgi:hypothetical protein